MFFCGKDVFFHRGASMENGTKSQKVLFALNGMFFSEVFVIQLLCNGKKYLVKKRTPPKKMPLMQQNSILTENSNVLPMYLTMACADCFGKTVVRL